MSADDRLRHIARHLSETISPLVAAAAAGCCRYAFGDGPDSASTTVITHPTARRDAQLLLQATAGHANAAPPVCWVPAVDCIGFY